MLTEQEDLDMCLEMELRSSLYFAWEATLSRVTFA